jgi:hypothetical protein
VVVVILLRAAGPVALVVVLVPALPQLVEQVQQDKGFQAARLLLFL